jgi:hypothetical protein
MQPGVKWEAGGGQEGSRREAGTLVNSLTSCVASGPMGYIDWLCTGETQHILLVVVLLMTLVQLTKLPFTNVFTTFSMDPKIVML